MANNTIEEKKTNTNLEKKYRPLVILLSIVIPIVVASLFRIKIEGFNFKFLPPVYATINGITAILLVLAVISIKNGNRKRHQLLMNMAVVCSVLFLIGYMAYHITTKTTYYGGTGASLIIYRFILASHIILSIAVIPLVMLTYLKGWSGNLVSHRKFAKFTFPIWLYVAVTGVVVYLMISPYY